MCLSKHYYYSLKGSSIPNLSYSSTLDKGFNSSNSLYCFISETNLKEIINFDCSGILKIKMIGFLEELRLMLQKYRGEADALERGEGWVTMHSKYLRLHYGERDYLTVTNLLISLGLIERDSDYKISGFSKSFRTLEKAKEGRRGFYVKYTGKIIDYFNKNKFYNPSINGDEDFSNKFLKLNLWRAKLADSADNVFEKYKNFDKSDYSYTGLSDIEHRQLYLIECKKTGRRFHNFMAISRESRNAITIDDELCCEVDYSACHPWLCLSFYKEEGEEKARYLSVLKSGFYKFIAEKLNEDISDQQKYSDFKISCIAQIFYDSPRETDGRKLLIFKNSFPYLYDVIQAEKHKSNSDFAIKLQTMEADLMFDGVFFRLFKEDLVAVPIHDGLICKKRDAKNIKLIMEQEFFTKYGYIPNVGIKNLTYDN